MPYKIIGPIKINPPNIEANDQAHDFPTRRYTWERAQSAARKLLGAEAAMERRPEGMPPQSTPGKGECGEYDRGTVMGDWPSQHRDFIAEVVRLSGIRGEGGNRDA